jgi:hypothetical protein
MSVSLADRIEGVEVMATTVLEGFVAARPTTEKSGFFNRAVKAVMEAQRRRADAYVGSYLAARHPELAKEAGFDVEALRRQPRTALYF